MLFPMKDSLLNGFLIFSILQALLFALLFLGKKKKSLPDMIIGIWLFLVAIQTLLIFSLRYSGSNGSLAWLPIVITLLYGPMLYLYVSKICCPGTKMKISDLFHFLPFLAFTFAGVFFHSSIIFLKILAGTSSLAGLSYCFLSLHLLRRHAVNIRNHFSFTEKINLAWLYKLIVGLILIWSGVVILVFLRRFLNIGFLLDWFYIAIPVFIFYIGYHGIRQQVIYSAESLAQETDNSRSGEANPVGAGEAYKKSGLRPVQMQMISEKMVRVMQADNLFLDSTLSLQELSSKLNVPPHHITQTLSEFIRKNFYDFVNSYRIDEFKKRIDKGDAENFSLLGIALDCGFNSKSSFNRIFKNMTGQTPSEYKTRRV
jgi:AraC-like DNA-binding protein